MSGARAMGSSAEMVYDWWGWVRRRRVRVYDSSNVLISLVIQGHEWRRARRKLARRKLYARL